MSITMIARLVGVSRPTLAKYLKVKVRKVKRSAEYETACRFCSATISIPLPRDHTARHELFHSKGLTCGECQTCFALELLVSFDDVEAQMQKRYCIE